ncbi:hypothetical protein [Streptomyces peucetius]|uniref:Uncharacterized protein n=1 Tax=Streptomyces peucetius TaxID=1950 RepID=A0ABY6IFB9_STRPE|nr:hypothetical protein [Streptomyces peucetius]UYQ65713.1 hypothetical protein OGH68_32510 [Streptomyces peucetius]
MSSTPPGPRRLRTSAIQYESLLAIARFRAIQFASATQQPSRRVFGGNTDARGNHANRILSRTGEAGHAPFIFSGTDASVPASGRRQQTPDVAPRRGQTTVDQDDRRGRRAKGLSKRRVVARQPDVVLAGKDVNPEEQQQSGQAETSGRPSGGDAGQQDDSADEGR